MIINRLNIVLPNKQIADAIEEIAVVVLVEMIVMAMTQTAVVLRCTSLITTKNSKTDLVSLLLFPTCMNS